ncbi:MAG: hypothetical protein HYZ57_12210 [Acidobacteria bacterium]|nr:hypothetical protein [Acidobacteriota bacterium]
MRSSVCAAFLLVALTPAFAIPPFSRKYETSCITCHVVPPKLNEFGRAFKNLGYRLPGDDAALVKQKPVSLGAPAWKQIWPEGVWPSSIPGGEYLGFVVTSNYYVNPSAKVTNEFDGIGEVALVMGGTLGESFSFFGDLGLFEQDHAGDVARLFIQYNHPRHYFNVTAGQFEPRAAAFSDHLRITRQTHYLFGTLPTIPAGNFFGFAPHQRGVEIWGAKEGRRKSGGLLWSFGVVNGEFGESAQELRDSAVGPVLRALEAARQENGGRFDVNSGKDVYVHASYKIGGLGVLGSGTGGPAAGAAAWRDNSLTLGAYFYRGTTGAFMGNGGEQVFANSGNTFTRAGISFDAWVSDLNVFGTWQRNHDRLKDGRAFNIDLPSLEADYVLPWPWIVPAARFEYIRPGFARRFSRWTLSTSFLIRANVVLSVDGTISKTAPALPLFDDRFRAALRFYF